MSIGKYQLGGVMGRMEEMVQGLRNTIGRYKIDRGMLRISIGNGSENQDGGVGRQPAPPRTTRTDRKSNGKEVRHQGKKKMNIHPDQ